VAIEVGVLVRDGSTVGGKVVVGDTKVESRVVVEEGVAVGFKLVFDCKHELRPRITKQPKKITNLLLLCSFLILASNLLALIIYLHEGNTSEYTIASISTHTHRPLIIVDLSRQIHRILECTLEFH